MEPAICPRAFRTRKRLASIDENRPRPSLLGCLNARSYGYRLRRRQCRVQPRSTVESQLCWLLRSPVGLVTGGRSPHASADTAIARAHGHRKRGPASGSHRVARTTGASHALRSHRPAETRLENRGRANATRAGRSFATSPRFSHSHVRRIARSACRLPRCRLYRELERMGILHGKRFAGRRRRRAHETPSTPMRTRTSRPVARVTTRIRTHGRKAGAQLIRVDARHERHAFHGARDG